MDKNKFFRGNIHIQIEPSPDGSFVIPKKASCYFLLIDSQRRFKAFKDAALKVLKNLLEFMAN